MELIELQNMANKRKIDILNYKMNKTKARIINYCNSYIFMDYSKFDSYTEEKYLLAEKLAHYYYDAYYTLSSSQKYRALKGKLLTCLPLKSILNFFYERNI